MRINLNSTYSKHYKKRIIPHSYLDKKAEERIRAFMRNPHDSILKDHRLAGTKKMFRSFWITGDIRIIYKPISQDLVEFVNIGTHNQVY